MIIFLAVAAYLLFNAVITMLMLEDRPLEHKMFTTIVLVLFGLPIIVIVIVVAIIIIIIKGMGGLL